MLKLILIVLVVAVAAVLVIASRRPDTFAIARSAHIDAPPEAIFPLINDVRAMLAWSPFEKDPAMKRTFSGPQAGTGAVYEFAGNMEVGSGRLAIVDSQPPSKVVFTLDMYKPMKGNNEIVFTLTPENGGTRVTWDMHGPSAFLPKLLGVFMDMEGMVSKEFDKGLAALKARAEQPSLQR